MSSCQTITDMIPEYINGRTETKQNAEIARHISSCPSCRADFALWTSVERSLRQSEKDAPPTNFYAVFEKIPDNKTEIEKIIKAGSYNMAFDIIRYVFSTVKTTYRLASLIN